MKPRRHRPDKKVVTYAMAKSTTLHFCKSTDPIVQVDVEPLDGMQKIRLGRALGVTAAQLSQAQALLAAAGLEHHRDDPRLLGAVLAAIATNYAAEVHASIHCPHWTEGSGLRFAEEKT